MQVHELELAERFEYLFDVALCQIEMQADTRRTQDATSDKTVSYVLKIKDLPLPLDSSPTPSIFLPKGSTQFGDISYKQAREYWQIIIRYVSFSLSYRD